MMCTRLLLVAMLISLSAATPMLVFRRGLVPKEQLIRSLLAMDQRLRHDDIVLSRIIDDLEHVSNFAPEGGDDIRMTKRKPVLAEEGGEGIRRLFNRD